MFPCKNPSVLLTSGYVSGLRIRMERSQKGVFNLPVPVLSAGNIRKDSNGYKTDTSLH